MVTCVFIDKTKQAADDAEHLKMTNELAAAFGIRGSDCALEVTLDLFQEKVLEEGVTKYLESLHIDIDHAQGFFELLDEDRNGILDARELVDGCLRLRGPARAVDVALLAQDTKILSERIDHHLDAIQVQVNTLVQKQLYGKIV